MMDFFQRLGSLVEQRWRDKNYNEDIFPDIAAQALAETNPSEQVDPWNIIEWLGKAIQIPPQQDIDARFGDPPITLYSGPRFYIDIYYWLDGTTSIHQHAFSGAFQVLSGSSIHSQYGFNREVEINSHLQVGQTVFKEVELLKKGQIRKILPGDRYIHSLFHLDRPSTTITIRTYQTPGVLPQFEYLKPYIASNPFFAEISSTKKVQSAALLLRMKHQDADSMISEMIAHSDFHTSFSILYTAFQHLTSDEMERIFQLSTGRERFNKLLEKARLKHGQLMDIVPRVFAELQRQLNMSRRRAYLTESDHRFFMALLLNVPQREMILDLVKQRFPEKDSVDTVADWVMEFSTTKVLGSAEPNILGMDYFDEDCLFILRCLLRGLSIEQIKQEVERSYPAEYATQLQDEFEDIYSSFHDSLLLQSLLFESTSIITEKASAAD